MLIVTSSTTNLKAKLGLPLLNQVAGWTVLGTYLSAILECVSYCCVSVLASILPFAPRLGQVEPSFRILTLFLGFSVCFIILSISVEGLFFCSYTATLAVWNEVEHTRRRYILREGKSLPAGKLRVEDIRTAIFFLFFVQVAFFGTGK